MEATCHAALGFRALRREAVLGRGVLSTDVFLHAVLLTLYFGVWA
jgi:hypothetical protein